MCLVIKELGVGFRWPPRLGNLVGPNEKRDQIPNERGETISRGAARPNRQQHLRMVTDMKHLASETFWSLAQDATVFIVPTVEIGDSQVFLVMPPWLRRVSIVSNARWSKSHAYRPLLFSTLKSIDPSFLHIVICSVYPPARSRKTRSKSSHDGSLRQCHRQEIAYIGTTNSERKNIRFH